MKKYLSLILAVVCSFALLVGCGNSTSNSSANENDNSVSSTDGLDPTVDYAALAGSTIKIAASPTPHAEILAVAKDILAKQDITLEIVEFTDYVQPNMATESGSVFANYFQHQPYLDDFNAKKSTHLKGVAPIHYEPFGLYPGKTAAIDELADGAQIAVPNDGTNEGRALYLLEAQGLITIREDAGLTATILDIVDNPKNLDIVELEAAQIPRSLGSVDMAVINGNYALQAGLHPGEDALVLEDSTETGAEAAKLYANVLCIHEDNADSDLAKALIAAVESDAVRTFITDTYNGGVVAMF